MLVVITSEENHKDEVKTIHALFENGLERLHLRKPKSSEEEYQTIVERINPKYYSRISIHQYHNLADKYSLGGKHFRKSDKLKPIENEAKITSTGTHSIEEFLQQEPFYDDVFLSPVFKSISKLDYFPTETLDINHINVKLRKKAIALGGLNTQTIKEAKNKGYVNFAVLGAIWLSKNPIKTFIELNSQ